MKITPDHIDELIARYLAGEASPAEVDGLLRWRNDSEANRKYFDQMELIFAKASVVHETIPFDTDEAWNKVRKKLQPGGKTVPIRRNDSGFLFLKIAAGVILLLATGLFTYYFFSSDRIQSMEILAGAHARPDSLPDGSNVFLNRQSRIEYTFDRKTQTHTANLSGEAYFDIRHEEKKDFIIKAGETFIKDIGTAFNVKAYPDSTTIEVVVEEGEVLFYTANNPGLSLKANDKGTYNKETGEFTMSEPEPNITAYKTKSFSFNDHALETVIETLNQVYDTRVSLDENLKNCRLTVSFSEERIEEIVQVIAETLGLSVEKQEDGIRLRGSGCGEAQSE